MLLVVAPGQQHAPAEPVLQPQAAAQLAFVELDFPVAQRSLQHRLARQLGELVSAAHRATVLALQIWAPEAAAAQVQAHPPQVGVARVQQGRRPQ